MQVTTKLTFEYMKKNKRRSMVTIMRNCYSYNTYHHNYDTFCELSRIYDK